MMTAASNSEGRKRAQEAASVQISGVGAPNSPEAGPSGSESANGSQANSQDSGAIGRLNDLLTSHRPNIVCEEIGPEPRHWRTRVKCDGDSCHFYAEGERYWAVKQQHTEHLTEVVAEHLADLVREHTDRALAEVAHELADSKAAHRIASEAADRFRDVISECLGLDENPGDDALVGQIRDHFGHSGPEPHRWRDFMTGAEAMRDQLITDRREGHQ